MPKLEIIKARSTQDIDAVQLAAVSFRPGLLKHLADHNLIRPQPTLDAARRVGRELLRILAADRSSLIPALRADR